MSEFSNPKTPTQLLVHVESGLEGERLDTVLTSELKKNQSEEFQNLSRSRVAKWIEEGRVSVNGSLVTKPSMKMLEGQSVTINIPEASTSHLVGDKNVKFTVVYEDSELLVIDKPAGLVVHPGAGTKEGTLVQGLLHHLGEGIKPVGDVLRPGIVHRLDKDTSGLMVVAKSEAAYHGLVKQFAPPRTISREYLALTGSMPHKSFFAPGDTTKGSISLSVGRHPVHRTKMAVRTKDGRIARTLFSVIESFAHGFLLRLTLDTGRTHQIRVHLQAAGAPIIGDPVYGAQPGAFSGKLLKAIKEFKRQALHATSLSFNHPVSGERLAFSSEPPDDMASLIRLFREER